MEIRPNALAIITKNSKLLVLKGTDENTGEVFYRLLGGGIEFGETSNQALVREFKEELNATLVNEKFIRTIENIFEFNSKKSHEITFLYSGDLAEEDLYNQEKVKIQDKENTFAEWVSIDEIKEKNIPVYPKETMGYL